MLTALTFAWAKLRTRRHLFAGAFVAVALGVALVASVGLRLAAAADPPPDKPQRFAAQPVVVMSHDTPTVEVDGGRTVPGAQRRFPVHSLWTKNCFASSPIWAPFTVIIPRRTRSA
ncbi:hypothetical protein ABZS88_11115 [Streptomyces sp. NPDC005480]|uniref:hypothetical protein n=1 Tax=Streptomyces sp. NPDC005480 TaxID=3154880 RepID=UPI00339E954D